MSIDLQDKAEPAAGVAEEPRQQEFAWAAGAEALATEEKPSPPHLGSLRRMHHAVKEIEPWGVLLAVAALCLSLAAFWIDYGERVEERTVRAWQLLTTRAAGNSGKIAALEYLNREDGLFCGSHGCLITLRHRTPLVGINLSDSGEEGGSVFLREVQLAAANLRGANLSKANLRGANLSRALLAGANLTGAHLTQANLTGVELYSANLRQVDLRYADLSGASLDDANLTGANLEDANLSDTDLNGANLTGTYLVDANLSAAYLNNANLTGAFLLNANLSGALLAGANLNGANLTGANLTDARGLTQYQLDDACGDVRTQLPFGRTVRSC